ncbi:hypothetical protein D3C85_1613440 [compost metagenome]
MSSRYDQFEFILHNGLHDHVRMLNSSFHKSKAKLVMQNLFQNFRCIHHFEHNINMWVLLSEWAKQAR